MRKTLQIIYLALCLAVLVYSLPKANNPEFGMVFGLLMMVLTFPIGLLVTFFLSLFFMVLGNSFGIIIPSNTLPLIILWFVFVATGFWQWFIMPPYLKNRFGKKADNTA
jgi:hypothetical protein